MAKNRFLNIYLSLSFFGLITISCYSADFSSVVPNVQNDVNRLCSVGSRVVGQPGHDIALARLHESIASLRNTKTWTQEFPVVMPKVQEATLTLHEELLSSRNRIYPLWPASVRMNTTPADGITGKLIYVGQGAFGEIPVKSVYGQIAVMEMTGNASWQTLFALGAKAVVLLGSESVDSSDADTHVMAIPVNFPRFFVPEGELAKKLRVTEGLEGTLYVKSEWSEVTAVNTYALVKPENPIEPQKAFVIAVQFDSMSIVPEIAPGADGAVDVATALALLRVFSEQPPERPVLFAFLDAVAINQLGTREMLLSLACTPETREAMQTLDVKTREEYRNLMALVSDLKNGVIPISKIEKKWHTLLCRFGLWQLMHENWQLPLLLFILGVAQIVTLIYVLSGRARPTHAATSRWTSACTALVCLGTVLTLIGGAGLLFGEKKPYDEAKTTLEYLNRLHKPEYRLVQGPVKQELQKELLALNVKIEPLRLEVYKSEDGREKEQSQKQLGELEQRRRVFLETQEQLLKKKPLTEETIPVAMEIWNRAWGRMTGQLRALEEIFERDRQRDEMRDMLLAELGLANKAIDDEKDSKEKDGAGLLPISFVMGLDLSDAGEAVGPCLYDFFLLQNEERNARDFTRWLRMLVKDEEEIMPPDLRSVVDFEPIAGQESVMSHFVGKPASITSPALSFEIPAVTWATLNALRTRMDTPNDSPEKLDWNRLNPQIQATLYMVTKWVSDDRFVLLPAKISQYVTRMVGSIVDQAQGEPIARLPMVGYITAIAPYVSDDGQTMHIACSGMRYQEFTTTGIDGRFIFDGITGKAGYNFSAHAYLLNDEGAPIRAINHLVSKPSATMHNRSARKHKPVRATPFTCQEHSVAGLFDPRFLVPLYSIDVMDALRGDPKRKNQTIYNGMISFALEPGTSWQMLLRVGIVGNRMAFVNMLEPEKSKGMVLRRAMLGFPSGSGLPLHPMHISAKDFYNLDARRIADYKKAGISSKAIESIQEITKAELESADIAYKADDGDAYFRHISTALANEVRAYKAIRDTANDVVRGVIFLLLVLVPSAYAMERLIIASTHVYKQIVGGIGIFLIMIMILWSFHPAFRISNMPLMIVMAFGIIFLSLMVIQVLYSKFEVELEKLRRGQAVSHRAESAGLKLLSTQIRLGLANMRKRPLRTALTGLTVMLITFALLCFMSTSTYVEKSEYSINKRNVEPSMLIQQPGFSFMPGSAYDFMANGIGAAYPMAPRKWWIEPQDAQWRLHVSNTANDKRISLTGAIGLSSNEALVSHIDDICPEWQEFSAHGGCYLSVENAKELNAEPGDMLLIGGQKLKLVGVFDSSRFDEEIKAIDGSSILPPNYAMIDVNERNERTSTDMATLFVKMQAGLVIDEKTQGLPSLSSRDIVIFSADHEKGLPVQLRSVAVPVKSHSEARGLAVKMSDKLAFPIYFSFSGGVRVMVSRPLTPKAPKSLLIPLFIAGFIIFNTMLSSLAERKKEIYVYTSLGLAPFHIGIMFLAEALTYGVLGSIFGYIGGQGLATIFTKLGWMGGITLNFGGSQAVLTMLMVLGIVVVSSLAPAYLAGKVATPSNDMTWHVPTPRANEKGGQVVKDTLPFTATLKTSTGVLAFLYDYFAAHTDGAIGHMTTANLSVFRDETGNGSTIGVKGTVWLAPYDMGVRQEMELAIHEVDKEGDIHEINISLEHGSGQIASWCRLNKKFLSDLRRQLLGWRKMEPVEIIRFIEQGNRMLDGKSE